MRITNFTELMASTGRLQDAVQALDRSRLDISTGVRIHNISDDPTSGGQLIQIGSTLRGIEQYRRNITVATSRSDIEEQTLNGLSDTLARASELATAQSSSTASAQTRLIIKGEVDSLLEHAIDLSNTRFGDYYIFGGTRSNEKPFQMPTTPGGPFTALTDALGNPVNPTGGVPVEVGAGRYVTPNHSGTEVFIDTGVFDALKALSTALGNNDQTGIKTAAATLQSAGVSVQTLIAQQGSRGSTYEEASNALEAMELSLKTFRSDLQDTDIEKTVTTMAGRQTQYQAAMAATARILGMSLVHYL